MRSKRILIVLGNTLRKLRRPQNRWFLWLCSSLTAPESAQHSTLSTESRMKIPGKSQFWCRPFLRSCSPLQFYVDRGRRYYTYCKWKLNGSCRRDWRALSECDDALYAHDAKLYGWKLKQRGFPFPLRLLLTLICKEISIGGVPAFAFRQSQYIALTHFGISTQHSHCAHMTSFTDKLNVLKTDIRLNWSTENSVASS